MNKAIITFQIIDNMGLPYLSECSISNLPVKYVSDTEAIDKIVKVYGLKSPEQVIDFSIDYR